MVTTSIAPDGDLAQELAEVGRSAGALRDALRDANVLPDDFPHGDLDAMAVTLELTPAMSVEGAADRGCGHRAGVVSRSPSGTGRRLRSS